MGNKRLQWEDWDKCYHECRYLFAQGADLNVLVFVNTEKLELVKLANYLRGCFGVKRVGLEYSYEESVITVTNVQV